MLISLLQAFIEDDGVSVVQVDYGDVKAMTQALEENEIHTVISALALHIHGVGEAKVNLIKAANDTATTKRFIMSNWAVRSPDTYV